MPLIIAEIEKDSDLIVSTDDKIKLLDFVIEDDTDSSNLVDDNRIDEFKDILDKIKQKEEEEAKRKQDGTEKNPVQETVSADAKKEEIQKQKPKDKSSKSPETAPQNVDNSGAQTTDAVKNAVIKSSPVSTGIRVTSYIEQGKINDDSYWAYRKVDGPKDNSGVSDREKDPSVLAIKGFVKYRFQANWNNLTQGIPIKSIWDVLIAMNVPQVGIFNPKVPYVAEENTEQHIMILNNSMVYNRGNGTGIGLYQKNPSWAHEPYWCGVWTDFLTTRAGLSRDAGSTVDVDAYHRNLAGKGLVNAPSTGIKNNTGKIKFQDSWLPSTNEVFSSAGVGAIFIKGYHFHQKGELTENGKKLLNYLLGLEWGMATVSVGTSTHVETCVMLNSNGTMITIGGNTSGGNDRNGTQIAVKIQSISKFCGKKEYVVFGKLSGNYNRKSNRLNAKYNISDTMKKYIDSVNSKQKNINSNLYDFIKIIT